MTVEVETPEGLKTGSSVSQVRGTYNNIRFFLPEMRGMVLELKGEAVVVEVTKGKYLFALWRTRRDNEFGEVMAIRVFHDEIDVSKNGYGPGNFRKWAPKLERVREERIVEEEEYPLLVTFDDLSDSESVKEVDPNDLAATFGKGIALKSVKLELTDERVEYRHIKNVLPWWASHKGGLDGQKTVFVNAENQLANSLGAGSFSTKE